MLATNRTFIEHHLPLIEPELTGCYVTVGRIGEDSSDAVRVAGAATRGSGGAVRAVGGSGCRAYGCLHGARPHGPARVRAPLVPVESGRDGDCQSDRCRRGSRRDDWL